MQRRIGFWSSLIVALAVVVGAASPAHAQRLFTRHIDESDGLPSIQVWDIAQTPDGRLWFATRAGLAAWDGVGWEYHAVREGLSRLAQKVVVVDEAGTVWTVADQAASLRVFMQLPSG